jgi:hypothetical protein
VTPLELAGIGAAIGAFGWAAKLLLDIRTALGEITISLFGHAGDNGINGEVKILRNQMDTVRERVRALEPRGRQSD